MKIPATLLMSIFASLNLVMISPPWSESATQEDLGEIQSEIEALKEGQKAIRNDLKAIKDLLTARQKSRNPVQDIDLTIKVADDPAKGQANAKVTLIEFTDYQCPFCSRHTRAVLPQLEKDFIDTGKIRYVLRDFPLASLHPQAPKAHESAHCAGDQGKYWEMHDQLFANQKELEPEKLSDYAEAAGVADTSAFEACLDSGKYETQTNASLKEGKEAGVRGTPSFLLGHTKANGTVKAVKLIRGALPYSFFQQQINTLLTKKNTKEGSNFDQNE
ncbi:MAG: DsbA family protein [Nitrospirales bacterium]|nr:DsbA family protein [Nitrospirales bacterium]